MPAKSFHPVTPAILAIGLALSGLAAQADAQGLPPGCQPSNPNAPIEGALIGGAAGALLGSAIAGHHHKGAHLPCPIYYQQNHAGFDRLLKFSFPCGRAQ